MIAAVCCLLLPAGVSARATDRSEAGRNHHASRLVWLIETVTLEETHNQVAAWFGHPPQLQHAGPITRLSFPGSPTSEARGHGAQNHEEGRDACNAQLEWSFQFRGGRLDSVVWNPPDDALVEMPERLRRVRPTVVRPPGGAVLTAWRLDRERILPAVKGGSPAEEGAIWVLMRPQVVKSVYPPPAAFAGEGPPPSPR
jgi:hypothetical protein